MSGTRGDTRAADDAPIHATHVAGVGRLSARRTARCGSDAGGNNQNEGDDTGRAERGPHQAKQPVRHVKD